MTAASALFLIIAVFLIGYIPYIVWRGLKQGKRWSDIFTSTILLLLIFFIAVGETLRPYVDQQGMERYIESLLVGFIFIGIIPLLILTLLNIKRYGFKQEDRSKFKYTWLYKIRYLLTALLIITILVGLYMLGKLLKITF